MLLSFTIYFNNWQYVAPFRCVALQEELKTKTSSLSDTQNQLDCCEQGKAALERTVAKLTQEGEAQQVEWDKKAKDLAADLLKAQQEKETQKKELTSTQESLSKTRKALKECQSQLDTERKNQKAAMEEKVSSI